ncbi:MAG: aldo/keto reductase [Lautropia sp.]
MTVSRREFVTVTAATMAGAGSPVPALSADALIRRPIPASGEMLPAVGLGTARRYERADHEDALAPLRATIEKFAEFGGLLIDTAPSYGNAEAIIGKLIARIESRDRLFLSTKVGATGREAGIAQVEDSFRRLRPHRIDLISVHNLQDVPTQLPMLRDLREAQLIRYVGATTSNDRQYRDFEAMMRRERLDFIQVDYALDNRGAAERLLPLAVEREMAVMINLPFGRGRLFEATRGKPLPDWAGEFDCRSWAQFFLKYLIGHPAVTCVIPGMARPEYVADNLAAATGRLPDADLRRRMESFIDAL